MIIYSLTNPMEKHIKAWFIILASSIIALAILVTALKTYWLAWVSYWDYVTQKMPTIVANKEVLWTQEMEDKRIALEKAKEKKPSKVTPKVEKTKEKPKEVKIDTKIVLSDSIQVVACLNEKNMTIHKPKNWNCYLGQDGKWKNILLPPKSHIEQFKKIFGEDYKYRLAIANFEGSFNEEAKNPYAIGYLQTLRTHKVNKDVVSQLTWLKNREDKNTGVACDKYSKENFTLFGTIDIEKGKLAKYTCMARRHYWAFSPWDGKHWHHSVMYAKRYKATTEYYLSLSF